MKKKKVILLTIDCARQSSIYGNEIETPNIDQLRKDGVTFTEAFCQTNSTNLSMASIFTSWYLSDLKMYDGFISSDRLPQHYLIRYLKEKGWQTNAVYNLLTFPDFLKTYQKVHPFYKIRNRFSMRSVKTLANILEHILGKNYKRALSKISPVYESRKHYNAKLATTKAIDFMADPRAKVFSWIHYFDAHFPDHLLLYEDNVSDDIINKFNNLNRFMSANPMVKSEQRQIYDSYCRAIRYVDQAIGDLINYLKENNEYDDCLIILTSDHGENLLENDLYCGHFHLYESVTKVPLIIKFPSNHSRGTSYNGMVELVDLYPTILSVYGYEYENKKIRGLNLLDLLNGNNDAVDRHSVCEHENRYQVSIRDKSWQLIEQLPSKYWVGAVDKILGNNISSAGNQLLRRNDPQLKNYIETFPVEADRLRKRLAGILKINDLVGIK